MHTWPHVHIVRETILFKYTMVSEDDSSHLEVHYLQSSPLFPQQVVHVAQVLQLYR